MTRNIFLGELQASMIKINQRKKTIEVSFGWRVKGTFPVEGSIIPESDALVLFTVDTDDKGKDTLVAVDAVYPSKGRYGMDTARLFGRVEDVPLLEDGKFTITTWHKKLDLPRKRIRIRVILHNNEQLFEVEDLKFDTLHANEEFETGLLSIIRNGEVFDQTSRIVYQGTHIACTCFCGLDKSFPESSYKSSAASTLLPEDFQVGDLLFLDIPARQNYDFVKTLRSMACTQAALMQTFAEKNPISPLELTRRTQQHVAKTANLFVHAPIVRFREKKTDVSQPST